MTKQLPVRKTMCATCPWRKGSPHAVLRERLERSAKLEALRICHSTGSNAIHRRTGKPSAVCAGARKVQLEFMTRLGVIEAATEEAWQNTCDQTGIRNGVAGFVEDR